MLDINVGNLYNIFRDFYTLTGTRIVLFNKEKESLLEYPALKDTFCDIIAKDPNWKKKCSDCDCINVDACAKKEKTLKYSCHMGLYETVVPIYDQNGILGYVMLGQVLLKDSAEKTKKNLRKQFDEKDFCGIKEAIEKIPVKSTTELDASITILQALAVYILSNKWVTPQQSEFVRRLDKYVENNISNNINIEDISAEFHICRTHLYNISKEYLGCSIAEYVRRLRIKHACRMLRETDHSVISIAEKVGFLDYGHFSRVFRKIQGVTATNYRKNHRQR